MKIVTSGQSDIGTTRAGNEDAFLVDDDLSLMVVCDGMGGHAGGERAARIAVETVRDTVKAARDALNRAGETPGGYFGLTRLLERAFLDANRAVFDASQADRRLAGMGCTATALLVVDGKGVLAHVGDSRAYIVRDGKAHLLTTDHTVAQELVEMGRLTPEQADESPASHSLTRAVGSTEAVRVDTMILDLFPGDVGVLCSDGLSYYFEDLEEVASLAGLHAPATLAEAMVELANRRGGRDNITAVTLFVEADRDDEVEAARARRRLEALSKTPLFRDLSLARRQRVLSRCEVRSYESGSVVLESGAEVDGLYVLVEGQLSHTSGARIQPLSGAGSQYGALSLLRPIEIEGELVALRRSEVIRLQRSAFSELLQSRPRLGRRLLKGLASTLASGVERFPGEPF